MIDRKGAKFAKEKRFLLRSSRLSDPSIIFIKNRKGAKLAKEERFSLRSLRPPRSINHLQLLSSFSSRPSRLCGHQISTTKVYQITIFYPRPS